MKTRGPILASLVIPLLIACGPAGGDSPEAEACRKAAQELYLSGPAIQLCTDALTSTQDDPRSEGNFTAEQLVARGFLPGDGMRTETAGAVIGYALEEAYKHHSRSAETP